MTDNLSTDLLTVAVAVSAGVHAALVPEHWRERPALGIGFAVAAAALAATAVALQVSQRRSSSTATAVLLAGLTVLYLVSRLRGLPLTGHEEWDTVGLSTQAVQLAGIALALRPSWSPIRGGLNAHA